MALTFERLQHELRGTYRLEGELGGGGMSRIFAAEETALGRRVPCLRAFATAFFGSHSNDRFDIPKCTYLICTVNPHREAL